MSQKTKIIGLTGGIGSGKTTAAKFLEKLGFPVYYSDIRAKEIVNDDKTLKKNIIELLGSKAYDAEGNYNRKWVAEQIFNNDEKRQPLTSSIHPAVKEDFEKWTAAQQKKIAFKETALLFELNLDKECYKSLLITADENIRIKRVMQRDGKTESEIKKIIEKQMPESEKQKRADFVVFNNGNEEDLKADLEKILNEYKNSNLNADDVKNAVSEIFAKFENREGSELKEALKTKMSEIFTKFGISFNVNGGGMSR